MCTFVRQEYILFSIVNRQRLGVVWNRLLFETVTFNPVEVTTYYSKLY